MKLGMLSVDCCLVGPILNPNGDISRLADVSRPADVSRLADANLLV